MHCLNIKGKVESVLWQSSLGALISIFIGVTICCGKNVRPMRTRLKPRWLKERKIYYAIRPAPWISPKMALAPAAQGCGVFMPQNAEASKREGQKQSYNLSH
jgi:hypothetical protein